MEYASTNPTVYGKAEDLDDNLFELRLRRNIIFRDGSKVFLQKLGPQFYTTHLSMLEEIEEGRKRFKRVLDRCEKHDTATDREEQGPPNASQEPSRSESVASQEDDSTDAEEGSVFEVGHNGH